MLRRISQLGLSLASTIVISQCEENRASSKGYGLVEFGTTILGCPIYVTASSLRSEMVLYEMQ